MSYTHLTPCERNVIERMKRFGSSKAEIARMLGRDPSTISRELRRNRDADGYNPHWANLLYWKRREQKRLRYKTGDSRLMHCVAGRERVLLFSSPTRGTLDWWRFWRGAKRSFSRGKG